MKRTIYFAVMVALALALSGCGGQQPEVEDTPPPVTAVEEAPPPRDTFPNPLTGEPIEKATHLIAVMINNAPAARPQTGLGSADLVYEVEMEGMVTRFLAFFYGELPENVGSVRSARPYVMMLAKEWDAYFAHVGGSDDAFAKVKEWGIRDLDDVRGHKGFWVDKTGKRPHNTYLNLKEALEGKAENGKFHDWEFVDPPEGPPEYKEISFSYDQYNRPSYVFDEEQGVYLRYINGKPHLDKATGQQIAARNVIIQYARHRDLGTKLLHIDVELTGEGKAEYFLGGKHFTGTWRKKDLHSPTEYLDDQGNPIKLVRGKTWVQILRPGKAIHKVADNN
ncbi:MAG TPA: DUF3048 domain-containing protein [Clostridia bacterium]|nr:DUF3048 domain-containing protein [Clostridia bacterium]